MRLRSIDVCYFWYRYCRSLYRDLKDSGGIICLTFMRSDTWYEEMIASEEFTIGNVV